MRCDLIKTYKIQKRLDRLESAFLPDYGIYNTGSQPQDKMPILFHIHSWDVGFSAKTSIYCPSLIILEKVVVVSCLLELLTSMWCKYAQRAVREGVPGF